MRYYQVLTNTIKKNKTRKGEWDMSEEGRLGSKSGQGTLCWHLSKARKKKNCKLCD